MRDNEICLPEEEGEGGPGTAGREGLGATSLSRLPHPPLRLLQRCLQRLEVLVLQRLAAEALAQVEADDARRGLGGLRVAARGD